MKSYRLYFFALLFLSLRSLSAAPNIMATQDDATAAATRKLVGDTITYTTTISNTAPVIVGGTANDATGVTLTNPTPANTTDSGTVSISPVAFDDVYPQTVIANIGITSGNIPYSIFTNDFKGTPATAVIDSFTQPAHGVVTMVLSGANTGQFTYQPTAGYTGTDSFTYTISNAVGSSVGTVNLTVAAPVIWFVNPAAGSNGTGTLASPFNNMASAVTAIGTNSGQRIFLYSGTASTGVTLKSNGWLIGQGAVGTSFDTIMGLTAQSGWNARPAINGTRPTIAVASGIGVTLADGNTLRGLNVTNSSGSGISGNAVGTLTLADFDVTVTGGTALSLTTSGTVTVTGTDNDLAATNATALNVANVSIGASGITFKSIASSGATKGIVLNTTGSSGGLTITGTGTTDGSGGTIQNISVRGIELISTANVSISNVALTNANTVNGTSSDLDISASNAAIYMSGVATASFTNVDINTTADNGITGLNVSNFSFTNSTITLAGNAANESGIEFSNLSGTCTVTGSDISFSETNSMDIVNTDVALTLTVNGSTFRDTQTVSSGGAQSSVGEGGVQFRSFSNAAGAPVSNLILKNNNFLRLRTQGIQVVGQNDSIVNVDITGNTINSVADIGAGIDINANDTSQVNFNVIGNPLIHSQGADGVNITSFLSGTIQGRINNNPNINVASIGNGVRVVPQETSHATVEVKNNVISMNAGNNSSAIAAQARFQSARLDLTLDGNTTTVNSTALNDIDIISGSSAANETNAVYLNLKNNHASNGATNVLRLRVTDLDATSSPHIFLQGFVEGGAGLDDDAVATWNANTNTPTATTSNINVSLTGPPGNGAAPSAGTALIPTNPLPAPLVYAPGGVEKIEPLPKRANVESTTVGVQGSVIVDNHSTRAQAAPLTQSELNGIVAVALARWEASGLNAEQSGLLRGFAFEVSDDLPERYLGETNGRRIRVSRQAADDGWFIGADDAFFTSHVSTTRGYSEAHEAPAGHLDLLTAIMHEMGHALGLPDTYSEQDRDNVMYGFLTKGERRLPAKNQALNAVPNEKSGPHFLASPVNIGTLPPGKSVKIVYSVTVGPITGNPQSISSQGSVASNIATVLTSDAIAGSGPTVTLLGIAPAFTSANATTFTVGTAGNFSVTANGAPAPTFSFTGSLPSGVTLSAAGVLSGTPAAGTGGTYPITITANNGIAPNGTQSFTLTVNQPPAITSANATTFVVGTNGSFTVTKTGFPAPTLSQTGTLPSGVSFTPATGVLSGTPAAGTGGSYPISFKAANGVGSDAVQSFTLTVNQAPAITSANTATFTVGTAGNFNVIATGFPSPTINLTGTLPGGVNFGTGTLAGTPTAFGTFPLTFTASNGVGSNAVQSFSLVVNPSASAVKSGGNIAKDPGGYKINFLGNPGTQYTVQFSPSLVTPNWQTLELKIADPQGTFFSIDTPPVGTTPRFYRAIIP